MPSLPLPSDIRRHLIISKLLREFLPSLSVYSMYSEAFERSGEENNCFHRASELVVFEFRRKNWRERGGEDFNVHCSLFTLSILGLSSKFGGAVFDTSSGPPLNFLKRVIFPISHTLAVKILEKVLQGQKEKPRQIDVYCANCVTFVLAGIMQNKPKHFCA